MENYKIKASNEAESKEIQELFFNLGCGYGFEGFKNKDVQVFELGYPLYFFTYKDKNLSVSGGNSVFSLKTDHKEITLPQLRDLVVLKWNDVGDATHVNSRTNKPYLVQGDEEYYMMDGAWIPSNCLDELIPIKKVMKEYLNKSTGEYKKTDGVVSGDNWVEIPVEWVNFVYKRKSNNQLFFSDVEQANGDLILLWRRESNSNVVIKEYLDPRNGYKLIEAPESEASEPHASDWIEVPEGSEAYCYWRADDEFAFHKSEISIFEGGAWIKESAWSVAQILSGKSGAKILWQRSETEYLLQGKNGEHLKKSISELKQPEELPFIDDEFGPDLTKEQIDYLDKRKAIQSDGGSTDYYKKQIPVEMLNRFNETGVIEARDVIRLFLGNDFTKGNIFKAQVRINGLENGSGKAGITGEYDHNKIVFFAEDDRRAFIERNK